MASRYTSSRCSASSSTTSGASGSPRSRLRMTGRQSGRCSGMAQTRDARQRVDELFPARPVAGEHPFPVGGNAVVPLSTLAGSLHPAAGDQPPLLEPVEHGVERRDVELEDAVRALLDQFADLVAVPGPVLDQRQHQDLRAALDIGPQSVRHMWHLYICRWRMSNRATISTPRA